ncbi:acyl-CoA dehydrogenase family protein [uncultured Cellulomonas sp.]|uniref:acyl-CoA dehydrogenase family protein n=1 Tax=uncultured Cellulomonas sp. TaxID=189682 RepID=UPI002631157B|nr:acyl-CoA dehydrogenase family protein [uncultured Cellulomonas sp.]
MTTDTLPDRLPDPALHDAFGSRPTPAQVADPAGGPATTGDLDDLTTLPANLTGSVEPPPPDAELDAAFRPVFERIAAGALAREERRELPFEAVDRLRDAGFGALRVSRAAGGRGASLTQLVRLLIELAHADPNVAHLLRGHFAYLEHALTDHDPATRRFWAREAVAGRLIGNASSEQGNGGLWDTRTRVAPDVDGTWRLDGTKYYSTGTIFADWISVGAVRSDGERVTVAVRADAAGVERRDDWDGFGQRMTGSGTTVFVRVEVDPRGIVPYAARRPSILGAYFQLHLLATLAGIGRAVVGDAVGFVRPRSRTFGSAATPVPRADPLVQAVVGRLSAASFAADAIVLAAAEKLDALTRSAARGTATQEDHDDVDIAAYQAQLVVVDLVLRGATELFEVGGASATSGTRLLDRHWRNARTIASHNPVVAKERMVGDHVLNGTSPAAGLVTSVPPGAHVRASGR